MSRLTAEQASKLNMAAVAAVHVENLTGLPAEVPVSQFILETQWGKYILDGFNAFGLKSDTADRMAGTRKIKKTQEYFTDAELNNFKLMADGRSVVGPILDPKTGKQMQAGAGRKGWWVMDWFKTFTSLDGAFLFHSKLFTDPVRPYYKAFQKYKQDKNLDELFGSLKIYATAADYVSLLKTISKYPEVTLAISSARKLSNEPRPANLPS